MTLLEEIKQLDKNLIADERDLDESFSDYLKNKNFKLSISLSQYSSLSTFFYHEGNGYSALKEITKNCLFLKSLNFDEIELSKFGSYLVWLERDNLGESNRLHLVGNQVRIFEHEYDVNISYSFFYEKIVIIKEWIDDYFFPEIYDFEEFLEFLLWWIDYLRVQLDFNSYSDFLIELKESADISIFPFLYFWKYSEGKRVKIKCDNLSYSRYVIKFKNPNHNLLSIVLSDYKSRPWKENHQGRVPLEVYQGKALYFLIENCLAIQAEKADLNIYTVGKFMCSNNSTKGVLPQGTYWVLRRNSHSASIYYDVKNHKILLEKSNKKEFYNFEHFLEVLLWWKDFIEFFADYKLKDL